MRITPERLEDARLAAEGIESALDQKREDLWFEYQMRSGLSDAFMAELREKVE